MMNGMNFFAEHYYFWTPRNKKSLYVGVLLLAMAMLIQAYAGQYSYHKAISAAAAEDTLLDILPAVNLGWLIVQGSLISILIAMFLLVRYPYHFLFGLKVTALFIVVRAVFMTLTQIGIYPEGVDFKLSVGSGIYNFFNFPGNFFFSGHTGLPFLMALVFWHERPLRAFFLCLSLVFGVSVLLARVHYSIDVFAAPFIAYGIFKIAQWLFNGDYLILLKDYEG